MWSKFGEVSEEELFWKQIVEEKCEAEIPYEEDHDYGYNREQQEAGHGYWDFF